jgi:hypothetical protein
LLPDLHSGTEPGAYTGAPAYPSSTPLARAIPRSSAAYLRDGSSAWRVHTALSMGNAQDPTGLRIPGPFVDGLSTPGRLHIADQGERSQPKGPPELCAQVESCREHSPRLPRHGHDRAVGPRAARHPGTGGPTPRKTPPRGNRNLRLRQSKRKPPVSATIGPPTRVRLGRGLSRVLRARTSLARGLAVPHPNRRLTPQPRAGSCAREAVRPRPWWPGAVRYYQ